MAKRFPKADLVHPGENPNGFRSVGGAGYANRDPTHPGKKSGLDMAVVFDGPNVNGSRWSQLDRGRVDDQGAEHDW